jgi:hypothetical protein
MSELRYGNEEDDRLRLREDAIEWGKEYARAHGREVALSEWCKPTADDIDTGAIHEFTRRAWVAMQDALDDGFVLEDWGCEDGGPYLEDIDELEVSESWPLITAVVGHMVRSNIDLRVVAWIPTGVELRVGPDGIIDGSPASPLAPPPTEDPRITKIRGLLDGASTWNDLALAIHGIITEGADHE